MNILIYENEYEAAHAPCKNNFLASFIAVRLDGGRFQILKSRHYCISRDGCVVDADTFFYAIQSTINTNMICDPKLHESFAIYKQKNENKKLQDSIDKYHEDAMSAVGLYPIKGPLPPMPKCKPPKNQQTTQNESQTIESFWRDREIEIWKTTFTTLLQTHKTIRTGELYNICAKSVEEFRKVFNPRI